MNDKKRDEIRQLAKDRRVVPASQEYIKCFRAEVDQVLAAIAEARNNPKIVKAFVSDKSSVGNFFYCQYSTQRAGTVCEGGCVCDFSEQLKQIQQKLGVEFEIEMSQTLVFLAQQLHTMFLTDPENYKWETPS